MYLDYAAPIGEMREKLKEILAASDLWDGKTSVLQVTDATERSVQVRVLVSAADSPSVFDLRCQVREQLIEWVSSTHPEALPTDRIIGGPDPDHRALRSERFGLGDHDRPTRGAAGTERKAVLDGRRAVGAGTR